MGHKGRQRNEGTREQHGLGNSSSSACLGLYVNPADQSALGPIVEERDFPRTHTEERAAVDGVCGERGLESTGLLKIFEELDRRKALSHSILARIEGPDKIESVAKRLLAPSERRVYDVLS